MAIRSETNLALYAIRSCDCGGRVHPEPDDPLRGAFELDRHRIVESTAFRRLENKTQVFAPAEHDHFRTRLTHSLEVAQIARCLAGALQASEALAEAIALAHDLGHAPFGHAGEAALDEVMADHGGFNHNAHALRVVGYLEHPFPDFRGLNLTGETRAGLATHATRYDTPVQTRDATVSDAPRAAGFSPREPANEANPARPGAAGSAAPTGPSIEAQITSIADRIAYIGHDLEDAIGAEFI
ncbi:MAG: dNTP triphosphohydrolase, partial [Planctomycetes bacterium]|nr:dNTP triphosphohydrolase [Planctomycetota bacterium]